MTKKTYREEFNRLTHDCSAIFCFGLLAHAMGLSEYHAYEVIKNAKEKHYKEAIKLYKAMIDEDEQETIKMKIRLLNTEMERLRRGTTHE